MIASIAWLWRIVRFLEWRLSLSLILSRKWSWSRAGSWSASMITTLIRWISQRWRLRTWTLPLGSIALYSMPKTASQKNWLSTPGELKLAVISSTPVSWVLNLKKELTNRVRHWVRCFSIALRCHFCGMSIRIDNGSFYKRIPNKLPAFPLAFGYISTVFLSHESLLQ